MSAMQFEIESSDQCGRLDKALSILCADLSRSRLKSLIEQGHVLLNGDKCDNAAKKVVVGDEIEIHVPPPQAATPQAQDIKLDIVFEDEHLLVINKPAGMVVHPGAGNRDQTLVNALLHYCGEELSGIGGVMRPGIVHRLDKDTSGLMVVAKNDKAHKGLAAQLETRTLSRVYQAIVFGVPFPPKGEVNQAIGRHPTHRLKMAIRKKGGREARTFYTVGKRFGEACSLVMCKLESGRTHQIRVHMESIKHPLIGDPLYGPQPNAVRSALKKMDMESEDIDFVINFPRQALHAGSIAFDHPVTSEELGFEIPLPDDLSKLLKLLDK